MWQKKILFLCLAGGINAGASEKNNLYDPSSLIPNEHGLDIINYIVQQKEMKDHAQDDIASSKLSSASSSSVSGVAYCNPPKKTPKQSYKQTSNASTTSVLNDAEAVATAKRLAAARALIEQPCLNLSLKERNEIFAKQLKEIEEFKERLKKERDAGQITAAK